MKQLTCGSLFAGIGGFDLGFERAGIKTIWQVEIDEYCRRVLARHFPDAERFADIRDCCGYGGWEHMLRCPIDHHLRPVDILSLGFPCQPHSVAGPRTGANDQRWLWPAALYAIRSVRPNFVVVENVPGLFTTEFGTVMGGLASIGFDAEWDVISAAAFGAPHLRKRVFIVAYPKREGLSGREQYPRVFKPASPAYTEHCDGAFGSWRDLEAAIRSLPESDGVSVAMVRRAIKPIGNAVVPQIAEWIGRRIVEASS